MKSQSIKSTRNVVAASALVSALVSALTGCAVGPEYQRPSITTPAQFKEAGNWKPAEPADTRVRSAWWTEFGDADLDALMQQLLAANQNLRAAEARYRQATALAGQSRSALFPTATANASVTRGTSASINRNGVTSATNPSGMSASTATTTTANANLALNWELDVWGRVRRSVEASDAAEQASLADLGATQLSLQAELAIDYFALRIADAQRRLLDDAAAAYEQSLTLTKNRYAVGVATRADVAQAQAQWQQTRAQAIDNGVQRAQLEHAIAVLTGRAPSDFSLEPKVLSLVHPKTPPLLPSALLERRPDVAAAERRVASTNAQIGVAQAAWFPTFSLSASGGYRGGLPWATLFSVPNRIWSIGPALAETIFDGGARTARKAQAVAAWEESSALYRNTVLVAFEQVEDQLVALRLLEQEAIAQNEAVIAAQEALALTNNQYKAGTVSYLNVITTQAAALTSQRTALEITGRRLSAAVQLIKALGGGWRDAE